MRVGLVFVWFVLLSGCFGAPELAENAPEDGLISPASEAPEALVQELATVKNLPLEDVTVTPKKQAAPQKAGVLLPFGQIGMACGLRPGQLGTEVDRFPKQGKGYRLFDSKAGTTEPRSHYLTGFKDGCPRQFTAALALLESPVLHEQLLSVDKRPHRTTVDTAFQKIHAKICRVSGGKPCPEKRVGVLEKSVAFVTTYERFGSNDNWTEILMHKGKIAGNSFDK